MSCVRMRRWEETACLRLSKLGLFVLSGGDISPPQTGAFPSSSTLLVTSLSFLLTFPKWPLTPPSLSPLISIYIVMLNPTNVTNVTLVSLSAYRTLSRKHKSAGEGVQVRMENSRMHLTGINNISIRWCKIISYLAQGAKERGGEREKSCIMSLALPATGRLLMQQTSSCTKHICQIQEVRHRNSKETEFFWNMIYRADSTLLGMKLWGRGNDKCEGCVMITLACSKRQ